jgi:hypothetical protein
MAVKLARACSLTAIALALGCSDRSLSFGDNPNVLWWTDHETGDLSDWLGKTADGGYILAGNSRVEVVEGIARSGSHALLIADDSPNQRDYPLAARNGPLPIGVYASAWYYLPKAVHPTSYWWFVLWRSRHPPYDSSSFRDEIHLSFANRPDGTMSTTLETAELGTIAPLVEREIPIGRWFQIETYLRATDGSDGELKLWQDGELSYQVTGKMMETTWAEWMTGGVVDGLTTDASELYIDDAAISRERLGPLPPFSR